MKRKSPLTLAQKYPPSPACACEICVRFCRRPGWWTVSQARRAIQAGFGARMMLEVSPALDCGVLAPAFVGCEGNFALAELSGGGCTFIKDGLCELHNTPHMPLECRFCHHARLGAGARCHNELAQDWHTQGGQALVADWLQKYGMRARILQAALQAGKQARFIVR